MRDQALVHADLKPTHTAIDVGCGTGFTSLGVIAQVGTLTMLDQSHAQLSKAAKKPQLDSALKLVGDAESLLSARHYENEAVTEKIGKYDRYTSAGSIEYWPHPGQGIKEAFRVLKPGGKATIIGPVHPEWWLSKYFADVWYLFPTRTEYTTWFEDAGFVDVTVHAITPEWYSETDRDHGLIMGFVVTGTRPADAADPPPNPWSDEAEAAVVSSSSRLLRVLLWLPRFLLGNLGGAYYAVLPMFIFLKNVYCAGSASTAWLAVLLGGGLPLLLWAVLPYSWMPYGDDKRLYEGIQDFYNKSSGIWEQVWGEHMHSGFYGTDGSDVEKDPQQAQHDMMEQLLNFSGLNTKGKRDKVGKIIDIGCGVGGSSRFLARSCQNADVTGVTLSDYQAGRAQAINSAEGMDTRVTNEVANALRLPYPDDSFDLAWSLESGEHMPDKEVWLAEVYRILKPGGTFVCVTWCHREEDDEAGGELSTAEVRHLGRISYNYHLPEWVPLSRYVEVCGKTGLQVGRTEDWTPSIMPFWPAVIRSALRPLVLLQLLCCTSWATIKGAITAILMMQGFNMQLLVFGAFVATKPAGASKKSRRRPASRSPSPAAKKSTTRRKSKKSAAGDAGASAGDDDDDSAAIYLYGHIPDASSFVSAFYRFSYPHTWVGTTLSISVVTYIAVKATTDPASIAALEADGYARLIREYLIALSSALCVNIYIVGINQVRSSHSASLPVCRVACLAASLPVLQLTERYSLWCLSVCPHRPQIYDVEIDRVNKPYLPLASGEWTNEFACWLCASLLAAGLGLGFAYGTPALQLTLGVSAALGTAYSTDLPGLRWKKYPILAAGCILSVRSVIVQVGFFTHIQQTLPSPVPWEDCDAITFSVAFILAFSIVIAFFKDLPDIAGDEAAGVRTMAVRIGVGNIFNGCVGALGLNYAGAVLYTLIQGNYPAAAAHAAMGAVLVNASGVWPRRCPSRCCLTDSLDCCLQCQSSAVTPPRANSQHARCALYRVPLHTRDLHPDRVACVRVVRLFHTYFIGHRWCRPRLGGRDQEVLHAHLEVLLRRVPHPAAALMINPSS